MTFKQKWFSKENIGFSEANVKNIKSYYKLKIKNLKLFMPLNPLTFHDFAGPYPN